MGQRRPGPPRLRRRLPALNPAHRRWPRQASAARIPCGQLFCEQVDRSLTAEPWQLLGLVADGIEEVVNHLGEGKLGYRDLIILCNIIKAGDTARHLLHASNLILERTARGESPAVGQLLLAATRGTPHYRQEIWKQVRVIFASELGEEFSSRKPSTPSLSNAGALAEDPQTANEDFRVRFMRMIRFLNEWSSDGRNHRHFQLTRR